MGKVLIYLVLFLLSGVAIFLIKKESSASDLFINIIASFLIIFTEKIIDNFNFIWLWVITHTKYRKEKIRFSISYLFKIKVDDKYLLVKGKRVPGQFQPVGGVFKRFRESYYALSKLDVTDDDNIPIDDVSIDDLRIKLPARNTVSFLKWYNSQLGREVSPYREFQEELIRTEILKHSDFPYVNYIHRKRHMTKIHYSEHFKCYEILIAEIFDLKPSEEQLSILKTLVGITSDEFIWAKQDLIERKGVTPGQTNSFTISETAIWTI
jgi:hypothetical protein